MTTSADPQPLRVEATARTLRAAVILTFLWAAILWIWLRLEATPVIVAMLLACTLPAAWDFATNRKSRLHLDMNILRWNSGRQNGQIALAQIEQVRFDTRLDLSVRVRVRTQSGPLIPIPHACLPPHPQLQDALDARGIETRRHHFSVF